MNEAFEPKILGVFCNWCSYAGADLAGVSRLKYPPNLRIVRVMCSGRVEPQMVLKAFASGADGVLVAGCHPGDCHYQQGNYKTLRRMVLLQQVLGQFGIEPGRFRLAWISANEGHRLVEVVQEMVAQLRQLGPLPRRPEVSMDLLPLARVQETRERSPVAPPATHPVGVAGMTQETDRSQSRG